MQSGPKGPGRSSELRPVVDTDTVQADRDCHRLTEANVIAHGNGGGVLGSMDAQLAQLQSQHAMPLLATPPIRKGDGCESRPSHFGPE